MNIFYNGKYFNKKAIHRVFQNRDFYPPKYLVNKMLKQITS